MNIIMKNESGKMTSIDTYIGEDRNGFAFVGHTEGLDEPGVIFTYAEYIRSIKSYMPIYLETFFKNIL